MDKPIYQHGEFGLLVVDPATGRTVTSLNPAQFFLPGSTTKLFTVSAAWDAFGSTQRTTTPLLTDGTLTGDTLTGNLILVAKGDLTMGGRLKPDGTIDYTPVDHTYGNAFPTLASLTPENPLAGLDSLATQVRARGITHVAGNVVVDNRLFDPDPSLTTDPTPIIINDNVIDVLSTPAQPGRPAGVTWRPQTSANTLNFQVKTVAEGQPSAITATTGTDGTITVSGTIAAGSHPWLSTLPVADPAAFARIAMIDALQRAGITVDAAATGPDPAPPAQDPASAPVATLVSPPFQQEAQLILKVSHNLGADLMVCLLAVHAGSKDCQSGFAGIKAFDTKAGVDVTQAAQADGQGGVPGDIFTPQAFIPLLKYWTTQPDGAQFRQALPVLGESGDLSLFGTDSPARGKVIAKTGTQAAVNPLNDTVMVTDRSMAGYLDTGGGHFDLFTVVFNDAQVSDSDQILSIAQDVAQIAALLQQDVAGATPTP